MPSSFVGAGENPSAAAPVKRAVPVDICRALFLNYKAGKPLWKLGGLGLWLRRQTGAGQFTVGELSITVTRSEIRLCSRHHNLIEDQMSVPGRRAQDHDQRHHSS
ncbi:hypothetical protein AGR4B_pAt20002 [Agrobacterium tumefaciens str. CFBP 5621]|nr:hypothetical protein AGR4B_pAt20002 [Agrobacterium tumefaciens str. CFBP 5621]